jgi:hypothetical protein
MWASQKGAGGTPAPVEDVVYASSGVTILDMGNNSSKLFRVTAGAGETIFQFANVPTSGIVTAFLQMDGFNAKSPGFADAMFWKNGVIPAFGVGRTLISLYTTDGEVWNATVVDTLMSEI